MRVVSQLRAHARLVVAALTAVLVALALPSGSWLTRALVGWDAAALLYLVATVLMITLSGPGQRRARALAMDDGAGVALSLAAGSALAGLAASVARLVESRHGAPGSFWLTATTVVLSWLLLHTVFALHYAHEDEVARHERPDAPAGLDFPGEEAPDEWDFFYFSFVIGVAAQTADVQIRDRGLRRLVTLHGVLSFWFNTTILALALNAAAAGL